MTLLKPAAAIAVLLALAAPAQAQWSIGSASPTRMAPAGKQHYVYFVFSNPGPGQEEEFNDWYQQFHMGDLIQTPQVTGGQRFRLVTSVAPKPTLAGNYFKYFVGWDNEETSPTAVPEQMRKAIQGGRTRLPPLINEALNAVFQAVAPRVTRPDGGKPAIVNPEDYKTPRPYRFMVMDFADAANGNDAAMTAALDAHIRQVLAVPGWLAAQRFQNTGANASSRPPMPPLPKYLTIYETEGVSAQAVQDALAAAVKAGTVTPLPLNPDTAQFTYWTPISPYATKADFQR